MTIPSSSPKDVLIPILEEANAAQELVERSWLDVKLIWPQSDEEVHEFLADVCAMANVGQEAYLLFGVKQRPFKCSSAPLRSSKWTDEAQVQQVVSSSLVPSVEVHVNDLSFAGETLSYVCITPSHDRPHVVREWRPLVMECGKAKRGKFENALLWREGAKNVSPRERRYPERALLEAMFYDRPGTSARVSVQVWERKRIEVKDMRRGMFLLKVPLLVCNHGVWNTAIHRIDVSGTVLVDRGGKSPECFPLRTGGASFFQYRDLTKREDFPLSAPAGQSMAILAWCGAPAEWWNSLPDGRHRVRVRATAIDPDQRKIEGEFECLMDKGKSDPDYE